MPVYRNYQILWASMHIMASISSEQTHSYTVISDTVNLAARLEDANKTYVPLVLISERRQNAGWAHIVGISWSSPTAKFISAGRKPYTSTPSP
jgi:hypothetical protein